MVTGPGDVLRSYLAAGDAQRFDEFPRVLHDAVVVHSPGGATCVGIAAQVDTWQAAHAGLSNLHHAVEQLLVSGDLVAAHVTVSGTHEGVFLGVEPTGNRLHVDQALFARVCDGGIREMWEVVDTGDGLRQLGVLAHQPLGLTRDPASDG
ncbi:MAG TPA: ester cyclase [Dermatophilaceae bacterium]|nr:ester cyclase [Dermatophilaceae bacterium]